MNKTKFTPAPWEAGEGEYGMGIVIANGQIISEVYGYYTERKRCYANAHLMAAAPKMYAKLSELEAVLRPTVPVLADDIAKLLKEVRGEE